MKDQWLWRKILAERQLASKFYKNIVKFKQDLLHQNKNKEV